MSTVGAADTVMNVDPAAQAVKARGYWEQIWRRLKRDRLALAGGAFIIFMFLSPSLARRSPAKLLGHGPNDQFFEGVDPTRSCRSGRCTR